MHVLKTNLQGENSSEPVRQLNNFDPNACVEIDGRGEIHFPECIRGSYWLKMALGVTVLRGTALRRETYVLSS